MNIRHDSQNLTFRRPFGAVEVGTPVYLAIYASGAKNVQLCFARDGEQAQLFPMEPSEEHPYLFEVTVEMPEEPGLCWYQFMIDLGSNRYYYGNAADGMGGEGSLSNLQAPSYRITVYRHAPVPKWYRQGIVYQIFPDRFARGADWQDRVIASAHPADWQGPKRVICQDWDDTPFYTKDSAGAVTRWPFFGGTLEGIREKLSYLEELGVTVIYLNPIFEASSNHRYDTADYMKIDPLLGDEAGFRRLCSEARSRGIRIILDGVFNHTGRDSRYFDYFANYGGRGAYWDIYSPYRQWFRFTPEDPGYDCWWGVPDLPSVEENDSSYQEFICGYDGVVRHWLREGASGWRLDVVDELPDFFVSKIRQAMKDEDSDSLLMGEVWEEATTKVAYNVRRHYFEGEELDCTMHYPFKDAAIDFCMGRITASDFCRRMMNIAESYPPENFYACLNLVGSHDSARILSVLGEAGDVPEADREAFRLSEWYHSIGTKRLKLITALQFAMPGVPCIYYGDEAGAEGLEDPYCRGTYPWGHEDPEIMENYRYWTRLYKEKSAYLVDGDYEFFAVDRECVGIRRTAGFDHLTVLVNRSLTETTTYEGRSVGPLTAIVY